jgi:hypothetical protein
MRPEDIEQAPDNLLFPAHAVRGKQKLTAKQKRFAREVAMGATKADAYRAAYPNATSQHSIVRHPYILARDERVQQEIAAIERAQAAEHIKSPAALRALVVHSLVEMATDPNVKESTRLQALKTLGTVTEVAAFTERKETRHIQSSEDARARIMDELRALMKAEAVDVTAHDADSLLAELAPHPVGTPQSDGEGPGEESHTIPPERSEVLPDSDPTPSPQEDPPGDGT